MMHEGGGELGIDLSRSFVVGDNATTSSAGKAVGARGSLVRTGYGAATRAAATGRAARAIVDNLMAAVAWILRQP